MSEATQHLPPTQWCRGMRRGMHHLLLMIEHIARISLPQSDLGNVPFHTQKLRYTLEDVSSKRGMEPEDVHPDLRAEHALFVADLTELITALLPQLKRFSARLSLRTGSSIGTDEEVLFWQLWSCLRAGCSAFSSTVVKWPTLWPAHQRPFHAGLIAAFHDVLGWLLTFSRSPAWLAMKPQHGLVSRDHELMIIMEQSINCLVHMYNVRPHSDMVSHLQALPSSFIPLLCCIATEQFGGAPLLVEPPAQQANTALHGGGHGSSASRATNNTGGSFYNYGTPTAHTYSLFRYLVSTINNILAVADKECTGPFAFLRTPSVVQLLKVVLTMPEESPSADKMHVNQSAVCLRNLLNLAREEAEASLGKLLPLCDGVTNRDSEGLPLHLNPLLSPAALETDVRVLHALSKPLGEGADEELLLKRHMLQWNILKLWTYSGKAHSLTQEALATMTRSVCGLAKQCTWQGLCMMQQQQQLLLGKEKCTLQACLPTHPAEQGQQHPVAKLAYVQLAAMGEEGMKEIREMMFQTSHFEIWKGLNSVHPKAGECCQTRLTC